MVTLLLSALLALAAAPDPARVGVIGAPAGSGPHKAVSEGVATLPGFVVYRPAGRLRGRLPVVVWGEGGCRDNGLMNSHFLREIASHDYLVVAVGHPREERAVGSAAEPAPPPPPGGFTGPGKGADETRYEQLLQAIAASADPRVTTTMIWNSGIYNRNPEGGRSGIHLRKDALDRLHAPIAYVTGGPQDIAHANAADDVARLTALPVFFAHMPVGHGGTFWTAPNGGAYGTLAVAWLDWQLKDRAAAARAFTGADCGYCRDPRWTVERFVAPR